jgi:ubiquinone/menaquinone biosynthesis C-methylase UbiE
MNYKEISKEWDDLAEIRLNDLKGGIDNSYEFHLKPPLLKMLTGCDLKTILDIGCGVGVFTYELSSIADRIVGIDISEKSIRLANKHCKAPNMEYKKVSFEDLEIDPGSISCIVANMTLMNIPDIDFFFNKAFKILAERGVLVFSITHPAFWPIYWKYDIGKFNYMYESEHHEIFRTRNKTYNLKTHHYHRPLHFYFNLMSKAGFKIRELLETGNEKGLTPYPRFLLIKCSKK